MATGKPIPVRSNGHDGRGYHRRPRNRRRSRTGAFTKELTEATTALGNALSAVRRAAANVIAGLLERETENLRAAEQRAALLRAELTAVSGLILSAEIGVLKIDRASAACIAEPVPWHDQPAVTAKVWLASRHGRAFRSAGAGRCSRPTSSFRGLAMPLCPEPPPWPDGTEPPATSNTSPPRSAAAIRFRHHRGAQRLGRGWLGAGRHRGHYLIFQRPYLAGEPAAAAARPQLRR